MSLQTFATALFSVGLLASSATAAPAPSKPRLAFIDLANGSGVDQAVANTAGDLVVVALSETGKFDVITKADVKTILGYEAQAQLLGCAEASCMVDLGGALGAAYLVAGSLGKLGRQYQLILSLIDVNQKTVARRIAVPVEGESALPEAIREGVRKLTGELVPDSGPIDACSSPPCAKDAIATCKRWWEENWDALTMIGIVPDGPYEQKMVDHKPSRIFRMLVRTRARDGSRDEYVAFIRYERVEGDWFFDEGSMNHLRGLPIHPDDPPVETAVQKILGDGFGAGHNKAQVLKIALGRFPDYTAAKDKEPASWEYRFDITYKENGQTKTCPEARAKLVKHGKTWQYAAVTDGGRCTDVLDAD